MNLQNRTGSELRFFLTFLIFTLFISGCGGGTPQPGTPPETSRAISVVLSAVSSRVVPGGGTAVSATVSNDSLLAGVAWSCIPANYCGYFQPPSTNSGMPTIYTAPAEAPAGGLVTISAKSVTDNSKGATSTIEITAAASQVQFEMSPPPTIQPSQIVNLSASVSNDSAGVTWSCAPKAACGTFSLASTGNGVATTYTAPASAAAGSVFTIVATSVTDGGKSAGASMLISAAASNATLNGQYAFFLSSPAGTRGTTSLLGSVRLNGDGTVTAGVADIVSPAVLDLQDQILPTSANPQPNTSSYTVDTTGHGTLKLRTAGGQRLGFSFAVTSPAHALLTETDGNPGSGTLDLQTPPAGGFAAAQITGGFSFTMTGTTKVSDATKVSCGGVFTADGVGSLSSGTLDVDTGGAVLTSSFSGSFTAPDSNGRGTLQLGGGKSFTYYIISPKALRLFEADNLNLMGGSAYAQGNSSVFFGDNYFYQHSGWSSVGLRTTAGQFSVPEGDNIIPLSGGISDSTAAGSPGQSDVSRRSQWLLCSFSGR